MGKSEILAELDRLANRPLSKHGNDDDDIDGENRDAEEAADLEEYNEEYEEEDNDYISSYFDNGEGMGESDGEANGEAIL